MPSQNLHRHNQWVLHQIRVHHAMKNLARTIVRCRSKEWVAPVKSHSLHSVVMIPHCLVRFCGEVHIVPRYTAVTTPCNEIVPPWMDCHACECTTPSKQLLDEELLNKVVYSYVILRCNEEDWSTRVEQNANHLSLVLLERTLSCLLG